MSEEKRIIINKVVLCALKSIMAYINESTGISYSSDKNCTIQTFKILKKNDEKINLIEIKSWLILKAKLKPNFAEDIVDIARKIYDGKYVRSSVNSPAWRDGIIDRWRKESEDEKYNSEEWRSPFS